MEKQIKLNYMALGDSYTIGEGVNMKDNFPSLLVSALAGKGYSFEPPQIIAKTGWRTDELEKAYLEKKITSAFQLITVLTGANDHYQKNSLNTYIDRLHQLLEQIFLLQRSYNSLIVISIPDYGYTPFGQHRQAEISKTIDEFNTENKILCEKLGIDYLDINLICRQAPQHPDWIGSDTLHPTRKMYEEWVKILLPLAEKKLVNFL